jgi:hypothetical protein
MFHPRLRYSCYSLLQHRWQTELEIRDKPSVSQYNCYKYWCICPSSTSPVWFKWRGLRVQSLFQAASFRCHRVVQQCALNLSHGPGTEGGNICVSKCHQQQLLNGLLGISCHSTSQPDTQVQQFPLLWIAEEVFSMKLWSANQNVPVDTNTESSFLLHWISVSVYCKIPSLQSRLQMYTWRI